MKPWLGVWPQDIPHAIEYPNISLGEVLHRAALRATDKPALYFRNTALTFKELNQLASRFATALQKLGINKGDRTAIYLPNCPQFIIAYYGALRAGGVVVTISPLYKERELENILVDSGARAIVAWDKLGNYVQSTQERTNVANIIITKGDSITPTNRIQTSDNPISSQGSHFLEMENLLATSIDNFEPVTIEPQNDLALLQYTGGTTGAPKGAMLTHNNLLVNAAQFSTWLQMRTGQETHLSALPFFHIYGMTTAMNAPIYTTSRIIIIQDARDLKAIVEAIDAYKPTIFCGVPSMYISLINHPDIGKHDLSSIRVCVSGATALPIEVQRKFEELTGGRLVEGYGLTEASPVTHVNPLDERNKNRIGSIGIPISNTDAKIVDLGDSERELPPQTPGELVVRGPQIMLGYWNDPEESRLVLRGGWLHTGDIATMDSDGYFRIVDRKRDMINVSGLKVWPQEVEEVLLEHPAIKEAAAIGIPDQVSGEAVKAFIVLRKEYRGRVGSKEISDFCKEKIAVYKAPKTIEFRDSVPKTSIGKILRRELRTRPTP